MTARVPLVAHLKTAGYLDPDLTQAEDGLLKWYPWTITLDPVRYGILLALIVQLGQCAFIGLVDVLIAVRRGDYVTAAQELRQNRVTQPLGVHLTRLAHGMETGSWPV